MGYRQAASAILLAALVLAGCAPMAKPAGSAALVVYVTKGNGAPARDAVVYLLPAEHAGIPPGPTPQPAVMDLVERQFAPRVLPVAAGTAVTFRNLDDVGHDVYSFSATGPLSLQLSPGVARTTASLSRPGPVTLGCKIHNEMIGYLYVTDAPYFGKTDGDGYLRLAGIPPGAYQLGIWWAGETEGHHERSVTLRPDMDQLVRIRL